MNDTVDIRWPEVGRYGMRWRHICRRTREFARYLGKAPRVVSSRAPLFGYVLHYGGYGLNYLGCALVAFGIFTMEEHVGIDEVIDGPVGVGVLLVFLTLMTGQFGERLLQPTADERLAADRRKPIVLLRSFCDDDVQLVIRYQSAGESGGFIIERFEEALAVQFQRYGPFVAVGKPGEPKPLLGAARKYLHEVDWRNAVVDWMGRALLLVVVAGRESGLAWEIEAAMDRGLLGKLLIVMPPPPTRQTLFGWKKLRREQESIRQQRWDRLRSLLASSAPFTDLPERPPAHLLALHLAADGKVVFVAGPDSPKKKDYDKAIRLAIFGMFCYSESKPVQH